MPSCSLFSRAIADFEEIARSIDTIMFGDAYRRIPLHNRGTKKVILNSDISSLSRVLWIY